jgi:hypothetical protein
MDDHHRAFVLTKRKALHLLNNTKFNLKFLPEPFRTVHCGLQFRTNDFLYNIFNKKVVQLFESGISEYSMKNHESFVATPKEDEKPPRLLNFDQFTNWLKVWLICVLVAWLCFFVEMWFGKLKRDFHLIVKKVKKVEKVKNGVIKQQLLVHNK